MPRRGTSRSEALRRALEAKSQRDIEHAERERLIEAALADYYQATAEAGRIRDTARRKADTLIEAGEKSAAGSVAAARDAVRRLRDLVGGNAEVAQLCGTTPAMIRTILAAAPRTSGDRAVSPGAPAEDTDGDGGAT